MIVRRLELRHFMEHKRLDLDWAPGLTLVTGPNGSGKSSLLEGVAWALYGETVRGSDPDGGTGACQATVVLENGGQAYEASRKRDKGKSSEVRFRRGDDDLAGITATETQRRIDSSLGDWTRFASTRVFAKEFLNRFASATDKERKALLEDVLGLGQFDRALALARESLGGAQKGQAAAESRAVAAGEALARAEARMAQEVLPTVPLSVLADQLKGVRDSLAQAKGEAASLSTMAERADSLRTTGPRSAQIRAAHEAKQARITELDGLIARGVPDRCPTCHQHVPEAHRNSVLSPLHGERDMLLEDRGRLGGQAAALEAQVDEEERSYQDLAKRARHAQKVVQAMAEALPPLEAAVARLEAAEARRRELEEEVSANQAGQHEAARLAGEARQAARVMEAATEVLGLRGARNLLLGRALKRLAQESNSILSRLSPGIEVEISGTSKLKSGKEVDAVSVSVKGAGGGSYRGASSGQRARIDVSILLGLAALQGTSGLVVFDEVFDSLDRQGVEAVSALLAEMAQTRQIVVMTHHEDFKSLFPQSSVWRTDRREDASTLEAA